MTDIPDNELRDKLELDTMVRPGGFTVSSWLEIAKVIEEYRQHRGLDPSTMVVYVLLREGVRITISGIRAAFTWTVLLTEDDAIRIVPNNEIVGVDIGRRPGPAPERPPLGFTVERVAEEAPARG